MYRSVSIALLAAAALATALSWNAASHAAGSGGRNSAGQQDKPYLVLVSLDGFGTTARGLTDTPVLDRLEREGIAAESMIPVFPSLTFPNHYSIATGLYPDEHGIVGNRFPSADGARWYSLYDRSAVQDGDWYAGEPIWVRAEKSGMVSAAFYFVGTEADVGGVRPSHYRLFDADVPGEARVDQALAWLALPDEERPHVVTLYFEDVDSASHDHGVTSPEAVAAVRRVDTWLGRLLDGLESLGIDDETYVVVVSDHGQADFLGTEPFVLDEHVDLGGAVVVEGGSYAMLYFDDPEPARIDAVTDAINRAWGSGSAYRRGDAPADWRVGDNPRFADVIVLADTGHAVLSSASRRDWLKPADHGWPPAHPSMHANFVARGPGLPAGESVGTIRSVDVYPLMLRMLELEPPQGFVPAPSALDAFPER